MYVPILTYHKVSNKFEWGINTIPIRAFETQIKYLSESNYYSISLEQYLNGDFQANSERHPVIITFDDADESVYLYAFPILRFYGFKATLFVISNYVGKVNSWDANLGGIYSSHLNWRQIIELSNKGWEIGSHTATHRDLLGLSPKEAKEELQFSKELIAEKVGRLIRFISYPFNRFDYRIISLARLIGYIGGCALSVNKNINGAPKEFYIQRYGVYAIDTLYWFKQKLFNSKLEQFKQRIINQASIGTIWYKRFRN
ncbi:MAG: polysaccharide deacetylase family protein [bacterium]|nr:MAG: polysaccharide deacetylase family protein [bacterium]